MRGHLMSTHTEYHLLLCTFCHRSGTRKSPHFYFKINQFETLRDAYLQGELEIQILLFQLEFQDNLHSMSRCHSEDLFPANFICHYILWQGL